MTKEKTYEETEINNNNTYIDQGSWCIGRFFVTYLNKVIAIGKKVPYQMKHIYKTDDNLEFKENFIKFSSWRLEKIRKQPEIS